MGVTGARVNVSGGDVNAREQNWGVNGDARGGVMHAYTDNYTETEIKQSTHHTEPVSSFMGEILPKAVHDGLFEGREGVDHLSESNWNLAHGLYLQ